MAREWKIAVKMEIQKKILWAALIFVFTLFAMQFVLPRENEKNKDAQLRIGAGDDISGYLVEQIVKQDGSSVKLSEQSMEGYEFQDC